MAARLYTEQFTGIFAPAHIRKESDSASRAEMMSAGARSLYPQLTAKSKEPLTIAQAPDFANYFKRTLFEHAFSTEVAIWPNKNDHADQLSYHQNVPIVALPQLSRYIAFSTNRSIDDCIRALAFCAQKSFGAISNLDVDKLLPADAVGYVVVNNPRRVVPRLDFLADGTTEPFRVPDEIASLLIQGRLAHVNQTVHSRPNYELTQDEHSYLTDAEMQELGSHIQRINKQPQEGWELLPRGIPAFRVDFGLRVLVKSPE